MNEAGKPTAVRLDPAVPLYPYRTGQAWGDQVRMPLASPRTDGAVAYFQEGLSRLHPPSWRPRFDDDLARALCQYAVALADKAGLEVVDGPYLQVVEDDGAVPRDWVVLRAIIWVDEYDLVTPMDEAATDGPA